MDYEKAYKEALERARVWKEKSGMPSDRQGILDDIFPELKESEDEKIRKELIGFLKDNEASFDIKSPVCQKICKYIVWLEKQKPVEWSEEDYTKLKSTIALLEHPAVISDNGEIVEKTIDWLKSLKPQPKQEWSEEDEEMKERVIDSLECYLSSCIDKDGEISQLVTEEIDWVKSLKPKNH